MEETIQKLYYVTEDEDHDFKSAKGMLLLLSILLGSRRSWTLQSTKLFPTNKKEHNPSQYRAPRCQWTMVIYRLSACTYLLVLFPGRINQCHTAWVIYIEGCLLDSVVCLWWWDSTIGEIRWISASLPRPFTTKASKLACFFGSSVCAMWTKTSLQVLALSKLFILYIHTHTDTHRFFMHTSIGFKATKTFVTKLPTSPCLFWVCDRL